VNLQEGLINNQGVLASKVMINKKHIISGTVPILFALALLGACKKLLPTDRDYFNTEARFTQTLYKPVMGRTTVMSDNFDAQSSSQPLTFKIVNPRNSDGIIAPELIKPFDVLVWKKAYTGKETSLEEIENKRAIEQHPLFEIREHSGEFILWAASNSRVLKALPDSGYTFDVEVTNNGGRRYFNNLKLQAYRERAYEPNRIDAISGASSNAPIRLNSINNFKAQRTGDPLNIGDVKVDFNKKQGSTGSSLTFRFLDSIGQTIDPAKFNLTAWNKLIHGFNMEKTGTYVKYNVAYPIPLVEIPTAYTTVDGKEATLKFSYDRLGFGGVKETADMSFNFNIYEKGEWEIIFSFTRDNPKFTNE